jgi:hypothetical protein
MIPKSRNGFSDKIMLNQRDKTGARGKGNGDWIRVVPGRVVIVRRCRQIMRLQPPLQLNF